jgi:hypothetical protein
VEHRRRPTASEAKSSRSQPAWRRRRRRYSAVSSGTRGSICVRPVASGPDSSFLTPT